MVSGLEFLAIACSGAYAYDSQTQGINTFSETDVGDPESPRMQGHDPHPAHRQDKVLLHPRPKRSAELADGLKRIEEMARSVHYSVNPESSSGFIPEMSAFSQSVRVRKSAGLATQFPIRGPVSLALTSFQGPSIWTRRPDEQWFPVPIPHNDAVISNSCSFFQPFSHQFDTTSIPVLGSGGGHLGQRNTQAIADDPRQAELRVPGSPPIILSEDQRGIREGEGEERREAVAVPTNDFELKYISNFLDAEENDERLGIQLPFEDSSDELEDEDDYVTASEYSERSEFDSPKHVPVHSEDEIPSPMSTRTSPTVSATSSPFSPAGSHEGPRPDPPKEIGMSVSNSYPTPTLPGTPDMRPILVPHLPWLKSISDAEVSFCMAAERALKRKACTRMRTNM